MLRRRQYSRHIQALWRVMSVYICSFRAHHAMKYKSGLRTVSLVTNLWSELGLKGEGLIKWKKLKLYSVAQHHRFSASDGDVRFSRDWASDCSHVTLVSSVDQRRHSRYPTVILNWVCVFSFLFLFSQGNILVNRFCFNQSFFLPFVFFFFFVFHVNRGILFFF